MRNDVLVAEISGKRPGDKTKRPTEYLDIAYDHCIISNNSDGYISDWDIVNVPDDYKEYYLSKMKMSDNAWYAPMNRSYAIKYAREKGYKYLIQLDDNITGLKVAYSLARGDVQKNYSAEYSVKKMPKMANDFIRALIEVLQNTNAGMAGLGMKGAAMPGEQYLSERYCYSFFALNLEKCIDEFQGDFEDDIEYRLRMAQKKIPAVQICFLLYGKTAQGGNKDLTGCRKAYAEAGVKRGEHMRQLYGDVYSCGTSGHSNFAGEQKQKGSYFRHKLKPKKIGVKVYDKQKIDDVMRDILKKYATSKPNKLVVKEIGGGGENGKRAELEADKNRE